MEQIDLVDENDVVVGITDKQTAHSNRQPHRVAAVFVFNKIGELYVQVHKKSNKLDHSVGGHVSQGESYIDAAMREAHEELGIKQPLDKIANLYTDKGSYKHMIELYECIAENSWTFVPNDEVEQIIPMKIDEIQNLMAENPQTFSTDFKLTFNKYCTLKGIHGKDKTMNNNPD